MTTKADFNAEEWATVAEGPLLAGLRVLTADKGGKIRESLAMGQTYTKAREERGESALLDELVKAPPSIDPERVKAAGDIGTATTERLREAVQILGAKASPGDVEAYKRFVLAVAEAAAKAHKEGGFLGVGGKQVSDEEQAALDAIAATLEVDPVEPSTD